MLFPKGLRKNNIFLKRKNRRIIRSPQTYVFSNESTLRIRWPKYWSFSFSISPSNEHPGLISFRMDWLDILAIQGTLMSLPQHHSSKASILGPWFWEGLGAGGEGDDIGWDGWMASPTQWTWVWVNSGSLWWTGRPGVLQFMGSQRAGHDWVTDWTETSSPSTWTRTLFPKETNLLSWWSPNAHVHLENLQRSIPIFPMSQIISLTFLFTVAQLYSQARLSITFSLNSLPFLKFTEKLKGQYKELFLEPLE